MSDKSDPSSPNTDGLSRRGLLRGVAVAAGSAALLAATIAPAQAKMTQQAAGYQDKPKGDQTCATCSFFKGPSTCLLVDGTVNANGWCRFYSKKS